MGNTTGIDHGMNPEAVATLCRWCHAINVVGGCWPKEIHRSGRWETKLPWYLRPFRNQIEKTLKRRCDQIEATTGIATIEAIIGHKEVLRDHQVVSGYRTAQEFEAWWSENAEPNWSTRLS